MPDDKDDYQVGYGKPPDHSRFVKGQSGNPRGRPPGAQNMKTLLTKALNELVVATAGVACRTDRFLAQARPLAF